MKKSVLTAVAVIVMLLSFGTAWAFEGSRPVKLTAQDVIAPKSGDPVDVAPFGEFRSWENGTDVGVLWEDARDIFKVVVKFADATNAPDLSTVKLQYWKDGWPRRRIPREKVSGSGASGWMNIGDWYKGSWQNADVKVTEGPDGTVTYTFKPINEKEFTDLRDFGATYRTALKMRLLFDGQAPKIASLHMFTDSTWDHATALIEWGGTAKSKQVWDGKAEAFNGYIEAVSPLGGSKVRMIDNNSWTSSVTGETDGIVVRAWYAKPEAMNSFDETVITIRTKQSNFSFLAKTFREQMVPDPDYKPIFIRDLGVLVKASRDANGYAQAERAFQNSTKSVYDRVTKLPEQTFTRTWGAMPVKNRMYMPLAVEGGREHFGIAANGDVSLSTSWQNRIKGPDTARSKWAGDTMTIFFGLSGDKSDGFIEDGYLPIPTTWYERGGVRYSEEAFATTLSGTLPKEGRVPAIEPQVLMLKFSLSNFNPTSKVAGLTITVRTGNGGEALVEQGGVVSSKLPEGELPRFYVNTNGSATLAASGNRLQCDVNVPAGATKEVYFAVPFQTPDTPEDIRALQALDYNGQHKMISSYWRKRSAQSTQIVTPEKMINQFFAANPSHQLINTENQVGTNERAMAKVGTFGYGVFTNESVMMTTDLDRRGYFDVAEKAYQTWIHYQGTGRLPGDFTTRDGVFYGAAGYEDGGYNQHHGWAMWGMGEHYWFTRDKTWLKRVAPNLVKACDWIIGQRNRTKTDECTGIRAIEYGLMPPGSLEDIGDWRSWMSNNVFNYWGMENVARALAEIKHPDAPRLLKEAAAYKQDIRRAFFEAMDRSPVVPLRDGTWVPCMPSEAHRRGRSFGWITETLEGSIHMIRCGLIDPREPAATWIMKDYEDNRYISDQFGYQVADFERDWFNLGGFSQQPSLLCTPTPYIMGDLPEQYLRAYFNSFAAGYFSDKAMLTEHPLPNLGDIRGDHFKSSDEAMSSSWLRWCFIWDEGKDLYLGKTMPRYWLANGKAVKIDRAQTHFGPMSMSMKSNVAKGSITMTIAPPTRNAPGATYARFRHPDSKKMKRVTVNGKPWKKFDAAKEWVVLPALKAKTVVVAYY